MKTFFLLAASATLLCACASGSDTTLAEKPAMKCDLIEATTGSRMVKRENCTPAADTTRRQ